MPEKKLYLMLCVCEVKNSQKVTSCPVIYVIYHVPTEEMVADILTKSLDRIKTKKFVDMLGLVNSK